MSYPPWQDARMNSARAFMRREDCEPERTPAESPFRNFIVRCLRCRSFRVRLSAVINSSTLSVR